MPRWWPEYTCSNMGQSGYGSCAIWYDDKTSAMTSFERRCNLHQQMSDGGMDDVELYRQIQLDSMRRAIAVELLVKQYGENGFAVKFKDDRSIEIELDVKGAVFADVQAAIIDAIDKHEVVNYLLAGPLIAEQSGKGVLVPDIALNVEADSIANIRVMLPLSKLTRA